MVEHVIHLPPPISLSGLIKQGSHVIIPDPSTQLLAQCICFSFSHLWSTSGELWIFQRAKGGHASWRLHACGVFSISIAICIYACGRKNFWALVTGGPRATGLAADGWSRAQGCCDAFSSSQSWMGFVRGRDPTCIALVRWAAARSLSSWSDFNTRILGGLRSLDSWSSINTRFLGGLSIAVVWSCLGGRCWILRRIHYVAWLAGVVIKRMKEKVWNKVQRRVYVEVTWNMES